MYSRVCHSTATYILHIHVCIHIHVHMYTTCCTCRSVPSVNTHNLFVSSVFLLFMLGKWNSETCRSSANKSDPRPLHKISSPSFHLSLMFDVGRRAVVQNATHQNLNLVDHSLLENCPQSSMPCCWTSVATPMCCNRRCQRCALSMDASQHCHVVFFGIRRHS